MSDYKVINRAYLINTGRFRNKSLCSNVCINNYNKKFNNTVNQTNLQSYPSRITNTFKSNMLKSKINFKNICINRQFGRQCGKGGMKLTNKF